MTSRKRSAVCRKRCGCCKLGKTVKKSVQGEYQLIFRLVIKLPVWWTTFLKLQSISRLAIIIIRPVNQHSDKNDAFIFRAYINSILWSTNSTKNQICSPVHYSHYQLPPSRIAIPSGIPTPLPICYGVKFIKMTYFREIMWRAILYY